MCCWLKSEAALRAFALQPTIHSYGVIYSSVVWAAGEEGAKLRFLPSTAQTTTTVYKFGESFGAGGGAAPQKSLQI